MCGRRDLPDQTLTIVVFRLWGGGRNRHRKGRTEKERKGEERTTRPETGKRRERKGKETKGGSRKAEETNKRK